MTALYVGACALYGWKLGSQPLSDNSFLWHLRTGHWILSHGIPRHDLYSYTAAGTDWVAQSWLAEACYALADQAAGAFGIRLVGAVLGALMGSSFYLLAYRIAGGRVRAIGVAVPALLASGTFWVSRPLLFGLACMVALLWIVEVPGSWIGRRPLVAIPIVMWLWADLHGSFILGFGYLGLHLAGRWLDGAPPWRGRERRLAEAGLLAVGCCLVNPYGWKLLYFPIGLMLRGDVLTAILEWQSPNFRSTAGILFGVWITVAFVVIAKAGRRPSHRDVLVIVPFLLLALWAQRNILLAPAVGLPILARVLAVQNDQQPILPEEWQLSVPEEWQGTQSKLNALLLALIVLAGGLWTYRVAVTPGFDLRRGYPVEAMEAVEKRGLLGHRLLTTDAWAGYVIHEYWPRQRVFIDDRYDMYPVRLSKEYFLLSEGAPGWASVLTEHGVDVVVWRPKAPLPQYLAFAPGWTRIYQDTVAVVFARVPPPS